MRDQFAFFGIKTPDRQALMRQTLATVGRFNTEAELSAYCELAWAAPQREHQYSAIGILQRHLKRLSAECPAQLQTLIQRKSWWDSIDPMATRVVGSVFSTHPEAAKSWLRQWRSEDIWLRRVAILFQLKYKADTDWPLLQAICAENAASEEFFIQKAIGWALREYSKTDAKAVQAFVKSTPLAPLSKREALKWLSNQQKR